VKVIREVFHMVSPLFAGSGSLMSYFCLLHSSAEKVGVVGDRGSGCDSGIECLITGILLNLWFCFHKGAGVVYLVWWAGQAK